jgi:hypothetical protein
VHQPGAGAAPPLLLPGWAHAFELACDAPSGQLGSAAFERAHRLAGLASHLAHDSCLRDEAPVGGRALGSPSPSPSPCWAPPPPPLAGLPLSLPLLGSPSPSPCWEATRYDLLQEADALAQANPHTNRNLG